MFSGLINSNYGHALLSGCFWPEKFVLSLFKRSYSGDLNKSLNYQMEVSGQWGTQMMMERLERVDETMINYCWEMQAAYLNKKGAIPVKKTKLPSLLC